MVLKRDLEAGQPMDKRLVIASGKVSVQTDHENSSKTIPCRLSHSLPFFLGHEER